MYIRLLSFLIPLEKVFNYKYLFFFLLNLTVVENEVNLLRYFTWICTSTTASTFHIIQKYCTFYSVTFN